MCVYVYMCVCKYKLNANADSVFLSKVIGSADLRLEDKRKNIFEKFRNLHGNQGIPVRRTMEAEMRLDAHCSVCWV